MGKTGKSGWRTSKPHKSDDSRIGKHTDTEYYDKKGNKDKSKGKLKVSGRKHKPSMTDIHSS
ncbi:MAG: hypothetical protein ABEI53_03015 [Candidatus Magasanikbacteria bacterium]